MRFSLLLLCAASTTAFLIPPEITTDEVKDARWHGQPAVKDLIHQLLEQQTTDIELECPDCPWQDVHHDSTIHLSFSTSDRTLAVNSHPLLPLSLARSHRQTVTTSLQHNDQILKVPLSFALEILSPIVSPHKDGLRLLPVTFTVLALDHKPVKVNTVSLKLLQPPQSGLVIVDVKQVPFERTPGATCTKKGWSLCRMRAMVAARMQILFDTARQHSGKVSSWVTPAKPCRKPHGHHRGPPRGPGHREHDHEREHPREHHRSHRQHHHHRAQRLSHMIHQTFRFFVIPALLGIIGGLTASALGMVVGQFIVWMYRKVHGEPEQIVEQVIFIDEKEAQELPAYEEIQTEDDEHSSTHEKC